MSVSLTRKYPNVIVKAYLTICRFHIKRLESLARDQIDPRLVYYVKDVLEEYDNKRLIDFVDVLKQSPYSPSNIYTFKNMTPLPSITICNGIAKLFLEELKQLRSALSAQLDTNALDGSWATPAHQKQPRMRNIVEEE